LVPEKFSWRGRHRYNDLAMPQSLTRALAIVSAAALLAAAAEDARAQFYNPDQQQQQSRPRPRPKPHRPKRPRETREKPVPAAPPDKRDSVVAEPGSPFNGRAYWLALSQCGGIYFKLNTLYTDVAVRARVTKPDPKANAEFTKGLNDAIKTTTAYYVSAERFLMTDRVMERQDAVLTYDGRAREAGDHVKTIDAALAAAKPCYALYQTCREAFPKACTEAELPLE
jgi:hypothetical protein